MEAFVVAVWFITAQNVRLFNKGRIIKIALNYSESAVVFFHIGN